MGKGIIKSGGTDGQYTVDLVYDNSVATARKETIQADIDDLDNNQIPAATTDKDNAQTTYNNAANDLNDYIASAGPVTVENAGEYQRQSAVVLNARAQYEFKLRFLNNLILRRNSLTAELNKLNTNTADTETITAWCADLTEDLSGTVGLIEVGYERENPVAIIRPDYIESAAYSAAKDGINTNFYNQTAHQIYTNRAYLPAMAKWKPRYRVGELTAKNGDTGTVQLDALDSSQQSINVNQSDTLTNVPIVYMTCNGAAFDVGDRVVVEFNGNWSTPKVIGFESHPKTCGILIYDKQLTYAGWETSFPMDGIVINSESKPNEYLDIVRTESDAVCHVNPLDVIIRYLDMTIRPNDYSANGTSTYVGITINWTSQATSQGEHWDEEAYVYTDRDRPAGNPPTGGDCTGLPLVYNSLSDTTTVNEFLDADFPDIQGTHRAYESTVRYSGYIFYPSHIKRINRVAAYTNNKHEFYWEELDFINVTETIINPGKKEVTYSLSSKKYTEVFENNQSTIKDETTVISGPYTLSITSHLDYSEGVVKIESKTVDLGVSQYKHAPYLAFSY